jgi:hypothetical protein
LWIGDCRLKTFYNLHSAFTNFLLIYLPCFYHLLQFHRLFDVSDQNGANDFPVAGEDFPVGPCAIAIAPVGDYRVFSRYIAYGSDINARDLEPGSEDQPVEIIGAAR